MKKISPGEVFVTSTEMPQHTYYNPRQQPNSWTKALDRYMRNPANALVVVGCTKLGKTLEIKAVVPDERGWVIAAPGMDLDSFLCELRSSLLLPTETSSSSDRTWAKETGSSTIGSTGIRLPILEVGGKKECNDSHKRTRQISKSETTLTTPGVIRRFIIDNKIPIVIDDCNLLRPNAQVEILSWLKPIAEEAGIPLLIVSSNNRVIRDVAARTNLDSRLELCEVGLWHNNELQRIAEQGFGTLEIGVEPKVLELLAQESYGAPFLMQQLCGKLCTTNQLRSNASSLRNLEERFFSDHAMEYSAPTFEGGVQTACQRGIDLERTLHGGERIDLNWVLLYALGAALPSLEVPIELQLRKSVNWMLASPEDRALKGPNLALAYVKLADRLDELLRDGSPIIVDVSSQSLRITNPFFAFYLRWIVNQRRIASEIQVPAAPPQWHDYQPSESKSFKYPRGFQKHRPEE